MQAHTSSPDARRSVTATARLLRSFALVAGMLVARNAAAQSTTGAEPTAMAGRAALTREQLTALAGSGTDDDRARIQERLRDGDFNVGDRIVLQLKRDTVITTDTLVVRAERRVEMDGIPPISLQGVLRSELDDRLNREIGRYIRSPNVRTGTLFRLAVLGEVGRPNFYYVSADMLISDVVVLAGGPTSSADIGKSTVKRNDKTVVDKSRFKQAVARGETLDQLSLRAGDELNVGKARVIDWHTVATTGGILLSLTVTAITLLHRTKGH